MTSDKPTPQSYNVPKLRFPGFAGEWEKLKIQELINDKIIAKPLDGNHGNIHPKSSDYVPEGIPFIMANNIRNGKIDFNNSSKIQKSQADKLQKGFSIKGDVLLTHKGTVGITAIVPSIETEYIMLTPQVTYYRVINELKLSREFLKFTFDNEKFQEELRIKSGGGTRAYIGITEQAKLKISLPDINEQQKIASFLSSVDSWIENLRAQKEALVSYKKGMMQKIFAREVRFKDENGEEFEEWKEKRLGEILRVQNGFAFKSNLFQKTGIPIIRISNISNNGNYMDLKDLVYYSELTREESFVISENNLIIAMSGATTGKVAIYNSKHKAYINQRVGLFKSKDSNILYYHFLTQFVFSDLFNEQINAVLVAGAQPNISSKSIEEFTMYLPCFVEQQKIADFLQSFDRLIEEKEVQVKRAEEWKKGVMQELFI